MADKTSRLAEIYKSEKAKGGGLASTFGKRALEKIDPRQMFDQKGLLAAALPSVFKAYKATPADKVKELSTAQSSSLGNVDGLISEFRDVKISSKISAKNSMSLPDMARDMNVMRQNIITLVKQQGGETTNKADMYFKKSSENEAAYESQFRKEKTKPSTSPTQQAPKKEDGGLLSGISSALGGLLSGISSTLSSIFSLENIAKIFGGSSIISGLMKLLPIITSGPFLALIGGITAAKWLMDLLDKKNSEANTEEKQKLRVAQDRGSQASKSARRIFQIDAGLTELLGDDKTDEDVSRFTAGEIRTKDELRDKIAEAKASGKRAIEIKESRVVKEAQAELHEDALKSQADGSIDAAEMRRMKIAPTPTPIESGGAGAGRGGQGGPTAEQLNTPTQIPSSEGAMDAGKKQLLDFIANKESAGAGYNALVYGKKGSNVPKSAPLTGMTIQEVFDYQRGMIASGHASTAVGRYQFLNGTLRDLVNKAKIPLSEKFTPETQDKLAGMLLDQAGYDKFKSGKISQDTFQNKVAGIWASLPKVDGTSDYTGIAGNKVGTTSSAFQTVLASASQIPPTPSTGSALVTTSTQVASASGQGGPTIVNNNTTNNTMASAGQKSQGTSTIPSAFDDVFIALLGRVT